MKWPASLFLVWALVAGGLTAAMNDSRKDIHSFGNPEQIRVTHVALDLEVSFPQKVLKGTATLAVQRTGGPSDAPLVLDTRELTIQKAEASPDGRTFTGVNFSLGKADPFLGTSLTVAVPADVKAVRLTYQTSPSASGLQWLTPAQTAGKKHPFLFSQSQAIHARSWIPLQDSPGVRVTYAARIRTPQELLAVMSAENDLQTPRDGDYSFQLRHPVPSYLIALAVGDLEVRPTGPRTAVYAERPVVEKAAKEFEDTEKMIQAVEKLYGPYRWGRYDLLVLPPSFPFGGMENPMLTFATPTVIAGDKSLVGLVAHELAHSWSGNLVTNATWSDFWLNEGFTTYLENRIQEAVYGKKQADIEAVLEMQQLQDELRTFAPRDQVLHIDLTGRDPDDGMTQVPYVKGALLLRQLEQAYGRERFDAFLRGYFDHFSFRSITTADFVQYLKQNLLDKDPGPGDKINFNAWINEPGLPAGAALPRSDAFEKVAALAKDWAARKITVQQINTQGWSTQEWVAFLNALPTGLGAARMAELDKAFRFTQSGNTEIEQPWLLLAIREGYRAADQRLEEFLQSIGRRKYIKPLYEELAKTPAGKQRAKTIYAKARPGYHPISQSTIDAIVK